MAKSFYVKPISMDTIVDVNGVKYKLNLNSLGMKSQSAIDYILKSDKHKKCLRLFFDEGGAIKFGTCSITMFDKPLKKPIPGLTVTDEEPSKSTEEKIDEVFREEPKKKRKKKKPKIVLTKRFKHQVGDIVDVCVIGYYHELEITARGKHDYGEVWYTGVLYDGTVYPKMTHEQGTNKWFIVLDKQSEELKKRNKERRKKS